MLDWGQRPVENANKNVSNGPFTQESKTSVLVSQNGRYKQTGPVWLFGWAISPENDTWSLPSRLLKVDIDGAKNVQNILP